MAVLWSSRVLAPRSVEALHHFHVLLQLCLELVNLPFLEEIERLILLPIVTKMGEFLARGYTAFRELGLGVESARHRRRWVCLRGLFMRLSGSVPCFPGRYWIWK